MLLAYVALDMSAQIQERAPRAFSPETDQADFRRVVMQAQRGNAVAVEQLLRLSYPRLLRSAKESVRSDDVASDMVQEALLKVSLNLRDLRNPSAFNKWANRILMRCCLAHFRRLEKERRIALLVEAESLSMPVAQQATDETSGDSDLIEAVESLGSKSQEVVRLHYFFGLSVQEIATRVRASAGAVKVRLHRARNELRDKLAIHERAVGEQPN